MDNFEKGSPVRQIVRQNIYNPANFIGRVDAQYLTSKYLEAESLSANDIQISKTVETAHLVDINSLVTAILADPFDVEDWKGSFTVSIPDGSILNGVYETAGDFSTELSYSSLIGLSPSDDETYKEVVMASANFRPTGGTTLSGIEMSSNVKVGGFENIEWTYKYEEDASATGSDPKYLHDFRITIDSTQILGYVVINADDSESHNFIIDVANPS